eukprot:258119-Lingulodinium_polyedra.AAC.1
MHARGELAGNGRLPEGPRLAHRFPEAGPGAFARPRAARGVAAPAPGVAQVPHGGCPPPRPRHLAR